MEDQVGDLRELAWYYAAHKEKAEAARAELAKAIQAAAAAGVRQIDIVKATGYNREQVRRIVAGRTR